MRPEVAHRRIEAFRKRFGEAHLYLAYHAAFPLALTPDLLYRLWANFQRDIHGEVLNIPWIAVADLLLSSLCDEVGHELYEMEKEVRNALLSELKANPRFDTERINELSDFLLAYVRQQLDSPDMDTRDFAQAQRWTALAYTRSSEAAREIASALSRLKLEDRAEWVRMASLVETFAEPLTEFEPLLIYTRGMADFLRGNQEGTAALFSRVDGQQQAIKVAGVSLNLPETIGNKHQFLQNEEATSEAQSSKVTRIVYVDNSPDNLFLVQGILEDEGYKVELENNSNLALVKIETSPPDLIIMEILMSGIDGYELTRRIRQNKQLPFIPILLITEHDQPSAVKGLDMGADDFIRKPVEVDEFLARVRSLLRLKRSIDEREQILRQFNSTSQEQQEADQTIALPQEHSDDSDVRELSLTLIEESRSSEQKREENISLYSIIDIGTLGGSESQAWAINNLGQVVGWSYINGDLSHHAFLWNSTSGIQDLNPLGSDNSAANDINDFGQIVIGTQGDHGRAFLWNKGTLTDLSTLGGSRSFPYGINNSSQIIGYSTTNGDTEEHAFLWENGAMIDLGTFPGNVQSIALDINKFGQVAGEGRIVPNGAIHAFLWNKTDGMQNLGTINGFSTSRAFGINDRGQVVGYFMYGKLQSHFFLWENGVMRDLGLGEAYSINNIGQVVGRAGLNGNAFIWENGVITNLNALIPSGSGWELTWARDINDAGQIVGLGKINGQTHAFLMTPTITKPTYR
jgi:probable HAF family extracellular repeat protein